MFVYMLTTEQRRAFFGLAKHLIAVDGKIEDRELRALQQIEIEAGLSSSDIEPSEPTEQRVLDVLKGKPARAAALLELLGLAYADSEYHPSESDVIRSLAAGLGVSDAELLQMENWVLRQMALATEAEQFLSEEE